MRETKAGVRGKGKREVRRGRKRGKGSKEGEMVGGGGR